MRKFIIKLEKQYIFAGYASYKNKKPEDEKKDSGVI